MGRWLFRRFARLILRGLMRLLTHTEVRGRENIPPAGPLIVAFNHLSHVDGLLIVALMPYPVEIIALADLLSVPGTAQALRAYGVIPVHRDAFDRDVIRRALQVLREGKVLILAPEARRSVTGALERARPGVAYLALKAGVPVLPVAIAGTERFFDDLKRFRRPRLRVTFGEPFAFSPYTDGRRREQRRRAADEVMVRIARMLPPRYRGVYEDRV